MSATRSRKIGVRFRAIPRVLREALPGTTIQIDRSPFELPEHFRAVEDEFKERAGAAIKILNDGVAGDAKAYWDGEARANRAVNTTLSRIDPARAQSLIRHAYVLTMVNSHVLLTSSICN